MKKADQLTPEAFIRILKENGFSENLPVITKVALKERDPFRILITTLLSLRTRDSVTEVAGERLFTEADTPEKILELGEEKTESLIYPVSFYRTKAERILKICRILITEFDSRVPESMAALLELPGVGRKTANLVLIEGFRKEEVCVDTHVHRVSNRVGVVKTGTPDETEKSLRQILKKSDRVVWGELLIAFGKEICRPVSPVCSQCPVNRSCPRSGVQKSR